MTKRMNMTKKILLVWSVCLFACGHSFGQFEKMIRLGGGGFSRSISVSNENGIKTTRVSENGKKYVIRQGDALVEVEFAHTYGPDDMEELKEKHPDLHMHVTSFPRKSGESKVELTVSVKEKVSAENESELKEKSEAAYKVFEKYTKKGAARGIRVGPFAPKIELDLDLDAPPRVIEIEKEARKQVEELRKKVLELGRRPRPAPGAKPEKGAGNEEKKDAESKKKKDLIKT